MAIALLLIIYLAYVSLGLPDTLLGAAWPAMREELGTGLGTAGAVSLVISLGTVVSSLLGSRLLSRFGTFFQRAFHCPVPVWIFLLSQPFLALGDGCSLRAGSRRGRRGAQ